MSRLHWSVRMCIVGVAVAFAYLLAVVASALSQNADLARAQNGPCPTRAPAPTVACQQLDTERAARAKEQTDAAAQRQMLQDKLDQALEDLAALRAELAAAGIDVPPTATRSSSSSSAPSTTPAATTAPRTTPRPVPSPSSTPRPSPRPSPSRTPSPSPGPLCQLIGVFC